MGNITPLSVCFAFNQAFRKIPENYFMEYVNVLMEQSKRSKNMGKRLS